MMRQFHELRRHEEGQALVLAAISMLILCICVLATINISFTVKEKIRLQNAADAGAYTVAAFEARALNFMAYTNRAMVVHYASQMNLLAILSYITFEMPIIMGLAKLIKLIPYVGTAIGTIIEYLFRIIASVYDNFVMLAIPAIDLATYILSWVQYAVSLSMLARTTTGAFDEVKRYNANYQLLWPFNVMTAASWGKVVDITKTPWPPLAVPGVRTQDMMDKALMTEIANSARHEWTAYGGKPWSNFSIWGFPRNLSSFGFDAGFASFRMGKTARTEYGTRSKGSGGFLGSLTNVTDEIYSVDRFFVKLKVLGFGFHIYLSGYAIADRKLGLHKATPEVDDECSGWLKKVCQKAVKPLMKELSNALNKAMNEMLKAFWHVGEKHLFHFGQLPYARFRPKASGKQMFNQPATMVMVTMPTAALTAKGRPFINRYGGSLGLSSANSRLTGRSAGFGSADARRSVPAPKRGYTTAVDFTPGAAPLPGLEEGLHAISAAVAYYHRPGDWREPPNLFNPLWGAKLMPVVDHPLINQFGLIRSVLGKQLVVH